MSKLRIDSQMIIRSGFAADDAEFTSDETNRRFFRITEEFAHLDEGAGIKTELRSVGKRNGGRAIPARLDHVVLVGHIAGNRFIHKRAGAGDGNRTCYRL